MKLLDCDRSTAQRRLKKWKCLTSYNRNGAYCALPDVVQFDQHGIWRCNGAFFSLYGNLSDTVAALVNQSKTGMTVAQLTQILRIDANSFIWSIAQSGAVAREKLNGRFVYLAVDEQRREQQRKNRLGHDSSRRLLRRKHALFIDGHVTYYTWQAWRDQTHEDWL